MMKVKRRILLFILVGLSICNVASAYEINVDLTLSSGACSASSVQNETITGANKAVDNDVNTYWLSSGTCPQWWIYDFGAGVSYPIDKVTIQQWAGTVGAFDVLGSNDGVSYILLLSSSLSFNTVKQVFVFVNSVSYRFIKLNFLSPTNSNTYIAEVELMVSTVSSTPTPIPTPTPTPVPAGTPTPVPEPTPTPVTGYANVTEQNYCFLLALSGCLCGFLMAFGLVVVFTQR